MYHPYTERAITTFIYLRKDNHPFNILEKILDIYLKASFINAIADLNKKF